MSQKARPAPSDTLHVTCAVPHSYDLGPSQRYRWEQWEPGLRDHGVDLTFLPFCTPELDRALRGRDLPRAALDATRRLPAWLSEMNASRSADVLIIPRKSMPEGSLLVERFFARRARAFVYDFDDAIFLLPPGRSAWGDLVIGARRRCAALCDDAQLVLAGNEFLAQYARQHCDSVRVVPTTVNTLTHAPRRQPKSASSVPVVGWIGSRTTAIYLEAILPQLAEAQRQSNFELLVVGAVVDLQGVRGRCEPWSSAAEVPLLQEMDIGLMPLVDSEWERGKCSLKALLYGAVGIPAVVSNVGTNPEAVLDGATGFLVSEPEQWAPRIVELVTNVALRRQLGEAARDHIENNYSAKRWVPELAAALREVATRGRAVGPRARAGRPS